MTTVVTIHSMESRFIIPLELYKVMIPLTELFSLIPAVGGSVYSGKGENLSQVV